ncbi:phytolongin Phyl1.1-like [Silene latifolia]|uniref:phytolongin Phyl1.1-like n=1 Tax=Silene latifolia TaxID=37657 RepID=UPI003D782892
MGAMEKGFVHYCCVSKGGRILQSYNNDNGGGDLEIEKLAALCLENVPQYHRWYSQTMNKRTYCCLMEDGFVYFAIAEVGLGNQALIRFLEHYRDEFKKITKRGSNSRLSWKGKGKGGMASSNLNSANLQEQLVPIIRQLITSLQNVGQSSNGSNGNGFNASSSPCGGGYRDVGEGSSSTKAPLLGMKSGKHEKRSKDHVIAMRGLELEEQCRSAERGLRVDSGSDDTGSTVSPGSMQKEMNASRRRSSSQTVKKKWCRLVRLVLAIDAGVCIILLGIWLVICKGFQCIR